jgi:hypothetical protein
MSGIKDYSTTPANNNAAPPNGFPEGMAPASVNDGMRQVMADIRSWFIAPQWIDFGDTPTQTGANTFLIPTDLTSRYTVGTRIRMIGSTPFTLTGTISASSYSAPNTSVTVAMDSGSLNSTLNAIAINESLKTSQYFLSSVFSLFDVTDVTKKIAFALSGITTGTTRTITIPDKSGTLAMTSDITSLRNFIDGYTLSTAGSSATMSIGAGQASDSTNAAYITLAASIDKTTGSWAVGSTNGGLDTGTIANSTWYHFYAIRRPDTGVVDVIFSLSASSPALPTNYTQYRLIGAAQTNGSAQWIVSLQPEFLQFQDQKSSGTAAGTFTAGSYVTRVINTSVTNGIGGASLASNQITLPAGTYHIQATAPGYSCGDHKIKLRNVTDSTDTLIGKTNTDAAGSVLMSLSQLGGVFSISSPKTFEIQHRCTTTKTTDGLGRGAGFGDIEIYADVQIWRL